MPGGQHVQRTTLPLSGVHTSPIQTRRKIEISGYGIVEITAD